MQIPKQVKKIINKLKKAGLDAFLVGGCVRDLIRAVEPEDWDVATNARPEEIQKIFPKSFCENKFGTVTVSKIEITPFRTEEKYTDKRHPDKIEWAKTIEEDLARRDFTINAIALGIEGTEFLNKKELGSFKIIDPFGSQEDLKKKIIRAVGRPEDRFSEDALRMLRAVRFAVVLGFDIEQKTAKAIEENSPWIQAISK